MTATASVTAPTPTTTPSPTASPSPVAAVCGNGILEAGETCDTCTGGTRSGLLCGQSAQPDLGCPGGTCTDGTCPGDCIVLACSTPGMPVQTFRVDFQAPTGSTPSALSALVGYRSNRVSLPGSGSAAGSRVKMRPSGTSQLVNDLNYAVRVLIQAQGGGSIPSGKLFTADFDSCQGAMPVTAADFGCTIESCGSSFGPIDDCTCNVSQP